MTRLADITNAMELTDGTVPVEAPANWTQGRTLYGGMTAALCLEAAYRVLPEPPPLRSAQFTFIGPATNLLTMRPRLLRQGRSSTVAGVECDNEKGAVARATFVFGAARESRITHDFLPMPDVPAPADCTAFLPEGTRGFFQNFDMRHAAGSRLISSAAAPETLVWVRHIDAAGANPTTAVLALADSLPPAAMTAFTEPAAISTMTWTVDFQQPPADGTGCFLLRTSSEEANSGYSLQSMTMWDEAGALIAVSRQVVALFC